MINIGFLSELVPTRRQQSNIFKLLGADTGVCGLSNSKVELLLLRRGRLNL